MGLWVHPCQESPIKCNFISFLYVPHEAVLFHLEKKFYLCSLVLFCFVVVFGFVPKLIPVGSGLIGKKILLCPGFISEKEL